MSQNLLTLDTNIFLSNVNVMLTRDGKYNAILAISFYTRSRANDGSGNDVTESLLDSGNITIASPILIANTTEGSRTGFYVEMRIDSKKPSTGGGSRTRDILSHLEDREFAQSISALLPE